MSIDRQPFILCHECFVIRYFLTVNRDQKLTLLALASYGHHFWRLKTQDGGGAMPPLIFFSKIVKETDFKTMIKIKK